MRTGMRTGKRTGKAPLHVTYINYIGSYTASGKQPVWHKPEGMEIPQLKLYNSLTKRKVCRLCLSIAS